VTWRECPFVVDARYKVLKSFESVGYSFEADEVVSLKKQDYSRYDCTTVYGFRCERTGEWMQWWSPDDQALGSAWYLFERTVANNGK
jgi:hypothetical protein